MKTLLLWMIRFYQVALSPLFPPCCRYYPSCSSYAYQAVSRWGIVKGTGLALCRLLRCHPWTDGGFDPVPGHLNKSAK